MSVFFKPLSGSNLGESIQIDYANEDDGNIFVYLSDSTKLFAIRISETDVDYFELTFEGTFLPSFNASDHMLTVTSTDYKVHFLGGNYWLAMKISKYDVPFGSSVKILELTENYLHYLDTDGNLFGFMLINYQNHK